MSHANEKEKQNQRGEQNRHGPFRVFD